MTATLPYVCRPVREYGCAFCCRHNKPRWHREGLDAEYEPHLYHQSKHGVSERSPSPDEVLARLGKGEGDR